MGCRGPGPGQGGDGASQSDGTEKESPWWSVGAHGTSVSGDDGGETGYRESDRTTDLTPVAGVSETGYRRMTVEVRGGRVVRQTTETVTTHSQDQDDRREDRRRVPTTVTDVRPGDRTGLARRLTPTPSSLGVGVGTPRGHQTGEPGRIPTWPGRPPPPRHFLRLDVETDDEPEDEVLGGLRGLYLSRQEPGSDRKRYSNPSLWGGLCPSSSDTTGTP